MALDFTFATDPVSWRYLTHISNAGVTMGKGTANGTMRVMVKNKTKEDAEWEEVLTASFQPQQTLAIATHDWVATSQLKNFVLDNFTVVNSTIKLDPGRDYDLIMKALAPFMEKTWTARH